MEAYIIYVFVGDVFIVDVVRWLLVLPFYIKKFLKSNLDLTWLNVGLRLEMVSDFKALFLLLVIKDNYAQLVAKI